MIKIAGFLRDHGATVNAHQRMPDAPLWQGTNP
jgi:hypothetical protein